jgi:predicted dehydrogenase
MSVPNPSLVPEQPVVGRSRIGFIGAGWIGQRRMKAIAQQSLAELAGIVEPDASKANAAREIAATCTIHDSIDALLDLDLDGIAIATPSALHAEQAILALEHGMSVFCQKPLARSREETQRVVDAAQAADRLLRVDFSYRFLQGVRQIRELIQSKALGDVYIVELTFHNAYGPDKAWFYDPRLSGGGCLIDLGIHLLDLVLWIFNYPTVCEVNGSVFKSGKRLRGCDRDAEDFAAACLRLENDVVVNLRCSWRAHAGCDAIIEFAVYGTAGGARLHNVNGSFFDFQTERFVGTRTEILSRPPEDWGGRAALDWLHQLSLSNRFEPGAQHFVDVADTLDRIYAQ